jgi:FtsZ-binding cell division protein ZapB
MMQRKEDNTTLSVTEQVKPLIQNAMLHLRTLEIAVTEADFERDMPQVMSRVQALLTALEEKNSPVDSEQAKEREKVNSLLTQFIDFLPKVTASTNLAIAAENLVTQSGVTRSAGVRGINYLMTLLGQKDLPTFLFTLKAAAVHKQGIIQSAQAILANNMALAKQDEALAEKEKAQLDAAIALVAVMAQIKDLYSALAAEKAKVPAKGLDVEQVTKSTPATGSSNATSASHVPGNEKELPNPLVKDCESLLRQIKETGLGQEDVAMTAYLIKKAKELESAENNPDVLRPLAEQLRNTLVSLNSTQVRLVKEAIADFAREGKKDKSKASKAVSIQRAFMHYDVEKRGHVMTDAFNDVQKELARPRTGDNQNSFFNAQGINRKKAASTYCEIMDKIDKQTHSNKK